MAIVLRQKAPQKGPEAIGRALRDLRGRSGHHELTTSALGGASINLSHPLPVYRLGLDQIVDLNCVKRAEHVGWRYLVDSAGGHVGFADLKGTDDAQPRFASFSQNQHAVRLRQAAEIAQSLGTSLTDEYEARILEVPALNVAAIWLSNKNDIFIPYMDIKRLHGADTRVEKNFITDLLAAADAARRHFPKATAAGNLEAKETARLIASDKVEGTNVCRSNGERIGAIEKVIIDKYTGKVAYAVMSVGGFLGLGEDYYPVPWSLLKYNERLGGYEFNLTDAQLKGAPKFNRDAEWDWEDPRQINDYYNSTVASRHGR